MPKKKKPAEGVKRKENPNVMGLRSAVLEQPITETLETNYMPYAMSVIVSRAIPEIDGFKPSCSTRCTTWGCSRSPAPRAPTSSGRR